MTTKRSGDKPRSKEGIMGTVASRVAHARKVVGYTQKRLAKEVGISESYESMIERGAREPAIDILASLARALRVPLAYFFATDPVDPVEERYRPLLEFARDIKLNRDDMETLIRVGKELF